MPSDTFFRLPEEKRQKLLSAIRSELTRVPFSELSINRIIHEAEISRGSFYQYFKDKRDLFFYLLQSHRDCLYSCLESILKSDDGDIFSASAVLFDRISDLFKTDSSNRTMLINLYGSFRMQDQTLIQMLRDAGFCNNSRILSLIDHSHLNLKTSEDLDLLFEMLEANILHALSELLIDFDNLAAVRTRLHKKLDLLQRSLTIKEEPNAR